MDMHGMNLADRIPAPAITLSIFLYTVNGGCRPVQKYASRRDVVYDTLISQNLVY